MPKLEIVLAFVFGIIFTAALLIIAVLIPNPSPQQFEIFRIIIAVAVAGIAAMIPGLLRVNIGASKTLAIQAGGALAVFVIVYFYSPARWVNGEPATVNQITHGDASPAIANVNGPVETNNH
jgi:hypothetical protein